MCLQRTLVAAAVVATAVLSASTALADLVLLLPSKGQVPGSMLSSILDTETRYAVIEAGHKAVDKDNTDAAIRGVADGNPDNADEYARMAKATNADWVLSPSVSPAAQGYHLELTAYQVKGGRSESVAREIDTNKVHTQVTEMLRVLLRPEGVGTGALPWETAPQLAPAAAGSTASRPSETATDGTRPLFFAGLGAGVSSALARPGQTVGSTTSAVGAVQAGVSPIEPVGFVLGFGANMTGPKAMMLDLGGRYLVKLNPILRLGPEVAAGLHIAQEGAKDKSFMLRGTVVAELSLGKSLAVEAHLGDVRYVPQPAGTLVLGGATAWGVLKF